MVPEPAKLVSVPPVVVTSLETKSVTASLSVKVMVSVESIFRVALPLRVIVTVGGRVSTATLSDAATLGLPLASVNFAAATATVAVPWNVADGVKVAV